MASKKKKRVKKLAKCPCCKNNVEQSDMQRTIALRFPEERVSGWANFDLFKEIQNYQWACDPCLFKRKALIGNLKKQLFCDHTPYLAYFDRTKTCRTCNETYTFTKEEQVYWYENLGFWVQSVSVNCTSCRKAIRTSRNLNTELSNLLSTPSDLTLEKCNRLAEIYTILDKEEKANYYLKLARGFS